MVLCGLVNQMRNMLHLLSDSQHYAGKFVPLLELGDTGQAKVIRAVFELFTQEVNIKIINVDLGSTLVAAGLHRRCDFFEKAWGAN